MVCQGLASLYDWLDCWTPWSWKRMERLQTLWRQRLRTPTMLEELGWAAVWNMYWEKEVSVRRRAEERKGWWTERSRCKSNTSPKWHQRAFQHSIPSKGPAFSFSHLFISFSFYLSTRNAVLHHLVVLSLPDRPSGILPEVIKFFSSLIVNSSFRSFTLREELDLTMSGLWNCENVVIFSTLSSSVTKKTGDVTSSWKFEVRPKLGEIVFCWTDGISECLLWCGSS